MHYTLAERLAHLAREIEELERVCALDRVPPGARGRLRLLRRKERWYQMKGYLPDPEPGRVTTKTLFQSGRLRERRPKPIFDYSPDVVLDPFSLL